MCYVILNNSSVYNLSPSKNLENTFDTLEVFFDRLSPEVSEIVNSHYHSSHYQAKLNVQAIKVKCPPVTNKFKIHVAIFYFYLLVN